VHTIIGRVNMAGEQIKFKTFEDKIVNYHQKLLQFFKKNEKKTSQQAKTLYKAKRDIINRINNSLDGILAFSQIIGGGLISKSVRKKNYRFSSLTLQNKLADFELAGQKNDVKIHFVKEQREFIQKIFTEDRFNEILSEIFRFNGSFVQPKLNQRENEINPKIKKWEHEKGDSPSKTDLTYYRTVANIFAKKGITEMEKFLDKNSPNDKPIINALESAKSLINEIANNPNRKIAYN